MSNADKCPDCGAAFLFVSDGTRFNECGTIGSIQSEYCRERTAHAETRRQDVRTMVPGTYGEALQQGWIKVGDCEPHEWDNRTSAENLVWIVGLLKRQREKWEKFKTWADKNLVAGNRRYVLSTIDLLDAETKEGR